jgi:hypothetical protein
MNETGTASQTNGQQYQPVTTTQKATLGLAGVIGGAVSGMTLGLLIGGVVSMVRSK